MKVLPVACLEDNYSYLVLDEKTNQVFAVDPVEPEKVLKSLEEFGGSKITAVFCTHHHWDHVGGNESLVATLGDNITVYGGDDRVPKITNTVEHEQTFEFGSLKIKALSTKGHTQGHICFFVTDPETNEKVVFTGDTLFIGGCGRFFEGSPADMHRSLVEVLAKLPKETKVYCGHEYTKGNLRFALSVDPDNEVLKKKAAWANEQSVTVPSTIGEELEFNPFMRVDNAAFQSVLNKGSDPVEVMRHLRETKDNFK
ncbi:hydroxyacylglutathione hydrolase [Conidiobolus coronatus NRRL 28638]|uniref:hydroxyacylglutathione hydrolase n=1 Tax=Conidiobolus coronatus (strain ATCC 28846 / CBS 209.66 / NRRL 28638) TaxID=796925 RepID=A0A137NSC8_CONC2|nr:hydroxyacylglutathione hydrolase [Conidiobolus coronatus NRRL 28638]|eukprot:KXN65673.1 hydroxyacylglutathione hydrolase [Conidiobolus coronatus NRRL 28638]